MVRPEAPLTPTRAAPGTTTGTVTEAETGAKAGTRTGTGTRAETRAETRAGTVTGRRERKKLATRAAVREAALRLGLRHGVENITVEQIATEADIALRTFFNYFSSKEEAVVAVVAAGSEALTAEFRARPRTESVLWALRQAVLAVVDHDDETSRDYIRATRLISRTPSLLPHQLALLASQEKALAEAIAERLRSGAEPAPSGIYPALCAATALTALRVVLGRWLEHAGGLDETPPMDILRQEIDQAIADLAAGLDRPGSAGAGDPPVTP